MNRVSSKSISVFIVFFLLKITLSFSQSPSNTIGGWLMFFNQTKIHKNWSLHSEIQYRSYEIAPNSEQLLIRAGINYHISSSTSATIGYGNITNYAYDNTINPGIQVAEDRIWQQFVMKNNTGKFFFEHRYRLEQRWINHQNNSNRYLNRVRYLLRITVPLNKKVIEKSTLFIGFYNEVFLHLTNTPFDRNRLYGALGYQLLPSANLQVGYLAQTVGTTTKQYIQVAINYNIDLTKKN